MLCDMEEGPESVSASSSLSLAHTSSISADDNCDCNSECDEGSSVQGGLGHTSSANSMTSLIPFPPNPGFSTAPPATNSMSPEPSRRSSHTPSSTHHTPGSQPSSNQGPLPKGVNNDMHTGGEG